jgi:cytidylate kinase
VIITVSRMYGCGGRDVAANVARQLGWSLLDSAMVDEVAARLGVSLSEVSSREEKVPSLVERISGALTLSAPESALPVADISMVELPEERLVAVQRSVIEESISQGNAVLVGRGARFILGERADALHVFCYAAHASLVEFAVKHRGVNPATAEKEVNKVNREREQYVKRHWGHDWRAMENYHLCLDTGKLGIPAAADAVVAAMKRRIEDRGSRIEG